MTKEEEFKEIMDYVNSLSAEEVEKCIEKLKSLKAELTK